MIITLMAVYVLIFIVLLSMRVFPLRCGYVMERKIIAILAGLDIVFFIAAFRIQQLQVLLVSVLFPALALYTSICEIRRGKNEIADFYIPENTYSVNQKLRVDIIGKPKLRSRTGILWDGKLIIMSEPFEGNGEALKLSCVKDKRDPEKYYCRTVQILNKKLDIRKLLFSGSLILAIFIMPMCIYIGKTHMETADFWLELSYGLLTCLIFGYVRLILRKSEKKWSIKIGRGVATVGYTIGVLEVIAKLLGFI